MIIARQFVSRRMGIEGIRLLTQSSKAGSESMRGFGEKGEVLPWGHVGGNSDGEIDFALARGRLKGGVVMK